MATTALKKANFKRGTDRIKRKDTWKKVGALAIGSALGNLAQIGANKVLATSTETSQFALGALASGATAITLFAFDYENAGYGAAATTATSAINFGASIVQRATK